MKRILITVLLTIFCFGIGLTSLVVNDLSNLNRWYQTEVRPTMHKDEHRDTHKDMHKEDMKNRQPKEWQKNTPTAESRAVPPAPPEATAPPATAPPMAPTPPNQTSNEGAVPTTTPAPQP